VGLPLPSTSSPALPPALSLGSEASGGGAGGLPLPSPSAARLGLGQRLSVLEVGVAEEVAQERAARHARALQARVGMLPIFCL
jgi:hypothetical protein